MSGEHTLFLHPSIERKTTNLTLKFSRSVCLFVCLLCSIPCTVFALISLSCYYSSRYADPGSHVAGSYPPSPLRARRGRALHVFIARSLLSAFSFLVDPRQITLYEVLARFNFLEGLVWADYRVCQQPTHRLRRRRQDLGCCWSRVRYSQITSTYRQGPIETRCESQSKKLPGNKPFSVLSPSR